jgi:hypothetical protein
MYESGISHSPLPTPYSLLSRQKEEGKGQKVYYWYLVVSAIKSVLTFMVTAIAHHLAIPNQFLRISLSLLCGLCASVVC